MTPVHGPGKPAPPGAPDDARWLERVRERLETDARDLDAATLSRLNRARQAALAQAARPRRPVWAWSAALATACVVAAVVTVWRLPAAPAPVPTASVSAQDFALLAGGEDYALVEDLEFYAWLDAQQAAGG